MKARKIALWGVMGALTLAICFLENLWELPFLPPGARPGFSNIVTVLAALTVGIGGIFYLTALTVLFALLTRGVTACLMSLAGGILSGGLTALLLKGSRRPFSLFGVAIAGACAHNAGQLAMACFLTQTGAVWLYGPILLVFSLISGAITGTILRLAAPYCIKEYQKL
ncbi:MAG: Gx transporter family protein [Clostridia bacterium]|nr:Gx transporter family protein [Clostridia bacterium]